MDTQACDTKMIKDRSMMRKINGAAEILRAGGLVGVSNKGETGVWTGTANAL